MIHVITRFIKLVLATLGLLSSFAGHAADPLQHPCPAPGPRPVSTPCTTPDPNAGPIPWPTPIGGPEWKPRPSEIEGFRETLERKRLEIEDLRAKNPAGNLEDYHKDIERYRKTIDIYKREYRE